MTKAELIDVVMSHTDTLECEHAILDAIEAYSAAINGAKKELNEELYEALHLLNKMQRRFEPAAKGYIKGEYLIKEAKEMIEKHGGEGAIFSVLESVFLKQKEELKP